jgi:hypothetical protein
MTYSNRRATVKNYALRLISLSALLTLALAASGARHFAGPLKEASAAPLGSAPPSAMQQNEPWTAVASTGVADESSIPLFGTTGASFGFRGAAGNLVGARYNVTNTFDNNPIPTLPGWTTLELGSTAQNATSVTATLYQVDPCTGQQTELCRARNHGELPIPTCEKCTFAVPIDFANFLYYVEVKVARANMNLQPAAHTLRIY